MTRESLRAVREILSVVSPLVGDLGKNFAELDRPDTFDLSDTKINCVSILSELVSLFQEFSDGIEKCDGLGADRMRALKEQIEVAQSENHALATEIISPKPVVMMDGYKRISNLDQARRKIDEILCAAEESPAESEAGASSTSTEEAPVEEKESPVVEAPPAAVMGPEDSPNTLSPETPVDLLKFIENPQEKTGDAVEPVLPEAEKKETPPPAEIPKPADRSGSLIFQGFEKIGGVPDLDSRISEQGKAAQLPPENAAKPKKEKKKKQPKPEVTAREPQSAEPAPAVSDSSMSEQEGGSPNLSEVSLEKDDLPKISKQRVWPPPPEKNPEPDKPVEVCESSTQEPPSCPEPAQPVLEKEPDEVPAGLHIQAPEDDKSLHHDFEQMKLLNDELINKVRSLEEQIEKLAGRKDQMAEVLESRLQRRIDFFEEKIQQAKNELTGEIEKKGIVIEKKLSAIVEKQEEKIVAQVRGGYEVRQEPPVLPGASTQAPSPDEGDAGEVEEPSGPSIFVQAVKVFLIALVIISLLVFGAYYLLTRGQSAPVAAKTQKAAAQTYDILPTPAYDRMTQKVPVSLDKRYLRLLVIQLKNNPDPKIRISMARRLAKWPWKDVPEILLETGMRDNNPDVVKASFETFKTVTGFPNPEDLSYAAAETWWLTHKPAVDQKLADAE
jgi:hypothetical protein